MKIIVIGSINIDFVIDTIDMPANGETVFAKSYDLLPGGKGANQAVAAARLGGDVSFYGKIGSDRLSDVALLNFKSSGIDTMYLKKVDGNTGCATILLNDNDNRILNVPGVNNTFTKDEINEELISKFDIILVQNEINYDVVEHIIEIGYKLGKIIIYNPAPFIKKINLELLKKITYITPNEIEAELLFGKDYKKLMIDFPEKIIVTLGSEGVQFYKDGKYSQILPSKVDVVDTTGAGDTFNGALATYLSLGNDLPNAIMKAVVAATESVKGFGAQDAMPWKGFN